MALSTTSAQGAMTGARFIESLKDSRQVWLDGDEVQDVTTHPAFSGMVHELARIYDLQHNDEYRDQMTFISAETGNPCSVSWLLPRSEQDLKIKRRNSEIWNEQSLGPAWPEPRRYGPSYHHALQHA